MAAKVDSSKLTLMDAVDLACLIEVEASQRYTDFAKRLGSRDPNDAGSVFQSMAVNEKKHGDELAERQQGREHAAAWLQAHASALGRHSSIDLQALFG